jgi:RNA polymerase sigma-70 factor (ECF subfamily)
MDVDALASELPDALPGLLHYARTLTRDQASAEDLVQETVVRALARAPGFRGDSSTTTWLHRILHNLAVDEGRRRREEPSEHVMSLVEAKWRDSAYTVDAEAVVLQAEDRSDLLEALAHLPFIYRSAVLLHDASELTVPEVAHVQDVTLPAAKQRLRRGRMMLVSELAAGRERREEMRGVPLRCWQARQHVSDYMDQALDEGTARVVEQHLAVCPTCPPLYAALVGVHQILRDSSRDPDTVVPPGLAERLRRAGPATRQPDAEADSSTRRFRLG